MEISDEPLFYKIKNININYLPICRDLYCCLKKKKTAGLCLKLTAKLNIKV